MKSSKISILAGAIIMAMSMLHTTECKAHSIDYKQKIGIISQSEDKPMLGPVDKLPEFPGGMQAMMTFLRKEIKYPQQCAQQGIEGRSHVTFVVNKKGKLTKIKVMKSAGHKLLDKEAIRAIKAMPKWIPGEHEGKTVSVRMTLPVSFKLNKK
jgi:protein TonB